MEDMKTKNTLCFWHRVFKKTDYYKKFVFIFSFRRR